RGGEAARSWSCRRRGQPAAPPRGDRRARHEADRCRPRPGGRSGPPPRAAPSLSTACTGSLLWDVASEPNLIELIDAIGSGDSTAAQHLLDATPSLTIARVSRADEFFIASCHAQVYEDDTALHAAAFAYDDALCRRLIDVGADVDARNRRGCTPLHSATIGQ